MASTVAKSGMLTNPSGAGESQQVAAERDGDHEKSRSHAATQLPREHVQQSRVHRDHRGELRWKNKGSSLCYNMISEVVNTKNNSELSCLYIYPQTRSLRQDMNQRKKQLIKRELSVSHCSLEKGIEQF